MVEVAGMKPDEEIISFTRNEWKHFLDELEMRGVKKISQCVNNARFLAVQDIADEQIKNGQLVTFNNFEEFEAMTDAKFHR